MTKSVNPNQFKLFMTGTEWKAHVTHSTDGPLDVLWPEKSAQAKGTNGHGAGVYQSMLTHGYVHDPKDPPTIVLEESPSGKEVRRVQSEGHHRVAAAADIETDTGKPVYIPTNYVDNTPAGRRARKAGGL